MHCSSFAFRWRTGHDSCIIGSALQYTPTQLVVCLCLGVLSFYLAQWEEYRTGHMYLGYVNVTEALVATELLLLLTAWQGPLFWIVSGWRDFVFVGVSLAAVAGDAVYVYNTLKATRVTCFRSVDFPLCFFFVLTRTKQNDAGRRRV